MGPPIGQPPALGPWLRARRQTLGRRAHLCLAQLLSPAGHRLRTHARQPRNMVAACQLNHVPQRVTPKLNAHTLLRNKNYLINYQKVTYRNPVFH